MAGKYNVNDPRELIKQSALKRARALLSEWRKTLPSEGPAETAAEGASRSASPEQEHRELKMTSDNRVGMPILRELSAFALTIGGLLLTIALLVAVLLRSDTRSYMSSVCRDLAWPLLVGKWEPTSSFAASHQRSERLNLLLYPGGEAVKSGQRGNWGVVTCGGPTVLIDLPQRSQTNSCELTIAPPIQPEDIRGVLTCGSERTAVRRTETRGWAPSAVISATIETRERIRQKHNEELSLSQRLLHWLDPGFYSD